MVRDYTFSIFSGVVLPAACTAHLCQHVEASHLEDNSSITGVQCNMDPAGSGGCRHND
jgi:hypothetical protein